MKVIEILPKFPQWETIPYADNFACQECGKSAIQGKDEYGNPTKEKPNLVGWCETNNGFMAVFECPCCHSKFRFHPQMEHFNLDQLDLYLGAYYIGDGDSIWIANAKELSAKLDKEEPIKKYMKGEKFLNEQIYHILITEKCNYQCPLCCNNFYDIGNLQTVTTDMLREAHTVCITGGEPLMHGIEAIIGLCQGLREQYPNIQKLYLYTSGLQLCDFSGNEIGYLYRFINGINVSPKSRNGYHSFARFINAPIWKSMSKRFVSKTNRLYVFEEQLKYWEEVQKEYDIHLDGTWQVIGRHWDTTFRTPDNEHFVRLPILF